MRVWDLDSGAVVHALAGHDQQVRAVAVTADGRRAVSCSTRTLRMWDLAHGAEIASFVSDSGIKAVAITQPGMRVIAGTSLGPVHLLELCAYEQLPGA